MLPRFGNFEGTFRVAGDLTPAHHHRTDSELVLWCLVWFWGTQEYVGMLWSREGWARLCAYVLHGANNRPGAAAP